MSATLRRTCQGSRPQASSAGTPSVRRFRLMSLRMSTPSTCRQSAPSCLAQEIKSRLSLLKLVSPPALLLPPQNQCQWFTAATEPVPMVASRVFHRRSRLSCLPPQTAPYPADLPPTTRTSSVLQRAPRQELLMRFVFSFLQETTVHIQGLAAVTHSRPRSARLSPGHGHGLPLLRSLLVVDLWLCVMLLAPLCLVLGSLFLGNGTGVPGRALKTKTYLGAALAEVYHFFWLSGL